LILRNITDLFLYIEVGRQLNAHALVGKNGLVQLQDANHWLVFDIGVIVDNHVQTVLHGANTLVNKFLQFGSFVHLELDVF
jgi:hypothetical protein